PLRSGGQGGGPPVADGGGPAHRPTRRGPDRTATTRGRRAPLPRAARAAAPRRRRPPGGRPPARAPPRAARAQPQRGHAPGGMRRRLLVARGLVHSPRLVLLDEPTVGLDPQVRADLWGLIAGLRASGVTVLMSTHYIEEAERLADTCALMSHGKVIARGSP